MITARTKKAVERAVDAWKSRAQIAERRLRSALIPADVAAREWRIHPLILSHYAHELGIEAVTIDGKRYYTVAQIERIDEASAYDEYDILRDQYKRIDKYETVGQMITDPRFNTKGDR